MIEDGITDGKYIETSDNTPRHLKRFQDFFIVIFINTEIMNQYLHVLISLTVFSLQPKLISLNALNIFLESLKLRPVIDQRGSYIYNASNVIAKYLTPFSKNEFSITDTLTFPELLKNSSNNEPYKDVSSDVKVRLQVFQSKKR